MELDIERDVQIDQFNLPKECVSLADTYRFYAEKASEAKSLVSQKQDFVKVVLAERRIAILNETQGKKPTVDTLNAMVDSDSEVVAARKELRDAEAIYNRLSVAVSAMEIKKGEVDNLVKLYCNAIYVDSKPKATEDMTMNGIDDYNRRSMTPFKK